METPRPPHPASSVAEVAAWVRLLPELEGAWEKIAAKIFEEEVDGNALYAYTSKLELKGDLGLTGGKATRLFQAVCALRAAPDQNEPPPPCGSHVDKSSACEKLGAFLTSIKLHRLVEPLAAEEVDFDALCVMNEEDLKELGLKKGPRAKILKSLAGREQTLAALQVQAAAAPAVIPAADPPAEPVDASLTRVDKHNAASRDHILLGEQSLSAPSAASTGGGPVVGAFTSV